MATKAFGVPFDVPFSESVIAKLPYFSTFFRMSNPEMTSPNATFF
jgi:hypothetical protein